MAGLPSNHGVFCQEFKLRFKNISAQICKSSIPHRLLLCKIRKKSEIFLRGLNCNFVDIFNLQPESFQRKVPVITACFR
jgi:hypothetical protein